MHTARGAYVGAAVTRVRFVAALVLLTVAACSSPREPAVEQKTARTPSPQPGDAPPGMVWIPGGQFMMGDDGPHSTEAERPVHAVYVDGFFMDIHTVTNAEFRAFVAATNYVTVAERAPTAEEILRGLPAGTPAPDPKLLVPGSVVFTPASNVTDLRDWSQWWRWTPGANWRHPNGPRSSITGKDNFPVVQVAWTDAVAYADWAGRRLPTEAEWEFAARAGLPNSEYSWGDTPFDEKHPQAHIYAGEFPTHIAEPKPVGSYAANRYGLHDMSGNVWQWVLDWYRPDSYASDAARGIVENPTGPPAGLSPRDGFEASRVTRGGSFLCSDSYCRGYRVSARSPGAPDSGASHIGFRTVMTVEQWRAWKQRTSAKGASE